MDYQIENAIQHLARRLNSYNGSSQQDAQQFIILKRRFRDFKTAWYNNRTTARKDAIKQYATRLSDPDGDRYMGLSSNTLATVWKINLWREEFELNENPQEGSGRKKKSRKKRGGFKQGQLVEINWPNKNGPSTWWKARIIADNGRPTIVVWWLGLFTPKGFPLHEEIRRPRPGDIRILQGKTKGGRRKSRKMKGKGNFFSTGNQEPQHRNLNELNYEDIRLGQTIVNILMVEDRLTRQDAIDETVNAHDYDVEQWHEYIQRANRRDQPLMRDILSLTPRSEEKQIQVSQKEQGGGKRRKSRKMKGGHHLYKRLCVSKYASQKQIRKAYNKLKKKKRLTSKIKHAYNILSKKKSRRKYNLRYKTRKI
jgi:hypothetical protein